MEKEKKLGQENAFPVVAFNDLGETTTVVRDHGISKRYWTAVMIAQGLVSRKGYMGMPDNKIAQEAYNLTDELLTQEDL